MPLGVLIPAPAITTTRRRSCLRICSATSCRLSCPCLPVPPQLPAPGAALAAADREKGLVSWSLLGAESTEGSLLAAAWLKPALERKTPQKGCRKVPGGQLLVLVFSKETLTYCQSNPYPPAGTFPCAFSKYQVWYPSERVFYGHRDGCGAVRTAA